MTCPKFAAWITPAAGAALCLTICAADLLRARELARGAASRRFGRGFTFNVRAL